MIPNFTYIKLPTVIKRILKKNLRDSLHDEIYISQELLKDSALKLLFSKCFHHKVPDQSLQGIYRFHGWDYLRKIILSLYIYRFLHNQWPSRSSTPYIDGPFNFLEEELSSFCSKGSYRSSLLAFYLRLMELKYQQELKVSSFKLIESCSKVIEVLSLMNVRGSEVDIAALQAWHFGEYYSWDILLNRIKNRYTYENLMSELSLPYKKTLTSNLLMYLLSIGDEENFSLERRV